MTEPIDLKYLCEAPETHRCDVWLYDSIESELWLELGQASLRQITVRHKNHWSLDAYVAPEKKTRDAPTDFEHDRVYACKLPLIAVELEMIEEHCFVIGAFIDPTAGVRDRAEPRFRVPSPGYDPRKHPEAWECEASGCVGTGDSRPHTIVPEGMFVPPFNPELFNDVRGRRVEIWIGPRS